MKTGDPEVVLEIGDHYLVRRNDKTWRKLHILNKKYETLNVEL